MTETEIDNSDDIFKQNTILAQDAYTCKIRGNKMTIPIGLVRILQLKPGDKIYFAKIGAQLYTHFKIELPGIAKNKITFRRIQWEGQKNNKVYFVRIPPLILKEYPDAFVLQLIHPKDMEIYLWKIVLYSKLMTDYADF